MLMLQTREWTSSFVMVIVLCAAFAALGVI